MLKGIPNFDLGGLYFQNICLYNEFQKKRHNVKPGITGWAQVNGRNAIRWDEKFELDVFYVQNVTFALDLKIMAKTVLNVFSRKDINTQGQATTERFKRKNT
ncbi:MAG: sugar transferase [Flavobacteriaceae bacterium]